jgi:hypothetical protein
MSSAPILRTASYFPVTPGTLFSEMKWGAMSDLDELSSAVATDSENSTRFKHALLTIKFANVATIQSQRFTIAVGNPNAASVSQAIFGVVTGMHSPDIGAGTSLDGRTVMASLDPSGAPAAAYAVAELPATDVFAGLAVFGGVNYSAIPGDAGGTKVAVETSDVLVFGVWAAAAAPAAAGTPGFEMFPFPGSTGNFVYGWYRVPAPRGKVIAPPRSLAAAAAVSVGRDSALSAGDNRLLIFGGVTGSGATTDAEIVRAISLSPAHRRLAEATAAVEEARHLIAARTSDPPTVTGTTLVFYAATVRAVCGRISELGARVGALEPVYLRQAETTYESAVQALHTHAFGFASLELAHEAYGYLETLASNPLPVAASVSDAAFFLATVGRLRAIALARANALEDAVRASFPASESAYLDAIAKAAESSIYVSRYGGARRTEAVRDAWLFDYLTGEWEELNLPGRISPRYATTAVPAWDLSRVYLFGGVSLTSAAPSREVWEFRGSDRAWTRIYVAAESGPPLPLLSLRHAAATCVPDGTIVLHGGFASCVGVTSIVAAEFAPEKYLDADFELKCDPSSAAHALAPDHSSATRVVSDAVWVFSPPGYGVSRRDTVGKWVQVPTISGFGAPAIDARANAFHSAIVAGADSFKRTYTLTFAGGINVSRNLALSPQRSVAAAAVEQPYPITDLIVRRSGVAPVAGAEGIDASLPVAAAGDKYVLSLAIANTAIWVVIIIFAIAAAFKPHET